jgi:beta-galactosidase
MPFISRRDLLSSGLALTASSALARSAWARAAAAIKDQMPAGSAEALAAIAPREQLLFDFGWKFTFGHGTDPARDLNFGFGQGDFDKTGGFDFSKGRVENSGFPV